MSEIDDIQMDNLGENESAVEAEKPFTEFELKMKNHGWDPNGKLSAEDWIDNGFKVKNKKLDSLFNSIETLKEKLVRQEKDAYAQARADLEAKRIAAIEEADLVTVKEIEQQQKVMTDPSVREYADAFVERNKTWLQGTTYRDLEMSAVCGVKDRVLVNEKLSPEEHFNQLEAFIKEKYPDYFGLQQPLIANAVEGKQAVSIKSNNNNKKMGWDDLDEYQKRAAKNLQKSTGMKIEEYIKGLQQLDNRL